MNIDLLHNLVGKEITPRKSCWEYEVNYPFMEKKLMKRPRENIFICSFLSKKSKELLMVSLLVEKVNVGSLLVIP
jgi:hypothetical protein